MCFRRIPGLAFRRNIPYMELKLHDLQSLASNQLQLQFYQVIKLNLPSRLILNFTNLTICFMYAGSWD